MRSLTVGIGTISALLALVLSSIPVLPLAAQSKPRVAVVDLSNNSSNNFWGDNLGAAAGDELATQLVQGGAFTVIEREMLAQILDEQQLGMSGAVDPSTMARIGELLGVQILISGSITKFSIDRKSGGLGPLSASYSEAETVLDIRAINTTTGEILTAVEGEGKKRLVGGRFAGVGFESTFDAGLAQEILRPAVEQAVEELQERQDVFEGLVVVADATIVGARDESVYIDKGENFGVVVGQQYEVHRVVDEIKDAQGNVLDRITDVVGVIEVTQVLSQSSVCKIVEGEAAQGDALKPR